MITTRQAIGFVASVLADRRELLTLTEVAEMLGVAPNTIRSWSADGYGGFPRPVRIGSRYRKWRRSDLLSWIGGLGPVEGDG